MPSFTSFAVKTLLEPTTKILSSSAATNSETHPNRPNNPESEEGLGGKPPVSQFYIQSPALYATPEPKPIPPGASALSVTPSPYVFNRKRRDLESSTSVDRRVDGFEVQGNLGGESSAGEIRFGASDCEIDGGIVKLTAEKEGEDEDEGFEEALCETRSVGSSVEFDDFSKQTIVSPKSVVFFDADDEFLSDGSISSRSSTRVSNLESEIRTARLALLEEIERRKAVEDTVNHMCNQWQRIGRKLTESGLTLPTPLPGSEFLADSVEQLIQELVVTRFVCEAIGAAQARDEAEAAAAKIIESKNHEISRLRDRLLYYETVNQEMSHRNQEVAETARRQRETRRRRRWLWGCVGTSIAVGASVIAYSCLSQASADFSATTDRSDASTTTSPHSL